MLHSFIQRRRGRILLACGMALLALFIARQPLFKNFEQRLYDRRARWAARAMEPDERIVIVAVDNESLARLDKVVGRWPWPRFIFAGVLNYASQAKAIGMDVILSEADRQYRGSDDEFARQAQEHGHVIAAIFFDSHSGPNTRLNELAPFSLPDHFLLSDPALQFNNAHLPYQELMDACASLGHVNYLPDSDGVIREYKLSARLRNVVIPALALALYEHVENISYDEMHLEQKLAITEGGGFAFVSPAREYTVYSIADVLDSLNEDLNGRTPFIPRSAFENKVVIIGLTAEGLQADRKITSLKSGAAGVSIHAAALDNLLNGYSFRIFGWFWAVLLTLLITVPVVFMRIDRPGLQVAVWLGFYIIFMVFAALAAFFLRWMFPVVAPTLGVLLTGVSLITLAWSFERERRAEMERMEKTKQQFTDMLVHDLKGRTASIIMAMSMLERQADVTESKFNIMGSIRVSSDRLLSQINALLDIRKMEEGKMQVEMHSESVRQLLLQAKEEFSLSARHLKKELHVQMMVPDALAMLDQQLFMRIMGNLIWNALNFAPKDSIVELGCEEGLETNQVRIYVANRGPVIQSEKRGKLFLPFESGQGRKGQVDDKISGTGLGLSFCKLAAEAMHGSIAVESPWMLCDEGTKMVLTFPAAKVLQS